MPPRHTSGIIGPLYAPIGADLQGIPMYLSGKNHRVAKYLALGNVVLNVKGTWYRVER